MEAYLRGHRAGRSSRLAWSAWDAGSRWSCLSLVWEGGSNLCCHQDDRNQEWLPGETPAGQRPQAARRSPACHPRGQTPEPALGEAWVGAQILLW